MANDASPPSRPPAAIGQASPSLSGRCWPRVRAGTQARAGPEEGATRQAEPAPRGQGEGPTAGGDARGASLHGSPPSLTEQAPEGPGWGASEGAAWGALARSLPPPAALPVASGPGRPVALCRLSSARRCSARPPADLPWGHSESALTVHSCACPLPGAVGGGSVGARATSALGPLTTLPRWLTGQRASGHGLPPGLPGVPDPFQL